MSDPFHQIYDEQQFFSEIRERISQVIHKRIQSEDSEDVIQSVMVEVRSRIQDFKTESNILPLVCEILRNSLREYFQQKKREEKVLEFSPDALYYYHSEVSDKEWQDIARKGIAHLKTEDSRCVEVINTAIQSSNIKNVSENLDMETTDVYRTLLRCRNSLMKVVTERLKTSLP
jgi:DNA-directed RNA polymerase specialized sigma24 family protein